MPVTRAQVNACREYFNRPYNRDAATENIKMNEAHAQMLGLFTRLNPYCCVYKRKYLEEKCVLNYDGEETRQLAVSTGVPYDLVEAYARRLYYERVQKRILHTFPHMMEAKPPMRGVLDKPW